LASFIRLAIPQRGSLVPFRSPLLPRILHVTHYDFCPAHEALRTTPGATIGVADRVWTIDASLEMYWF
jgi:hypothetical protein